MAEDEHNSWCWVRSVVGVMTESAAQDGQVQAV